MSIYCSCPRQEGFRKFVIEKYQIMAECNPEWIWIDDDVRLFGHFWNVMHGCFCPTCLKEFSRHTGIALDREALYAEIVKNTYPSENRVRREWLQFIASQIEELHELISKTVKAKNPAIGLGAMNTGFYWHTAYYCNFPKRYEVLRANSKETLRTRPGGGAFTDNNLLKRSARHGVCRCRISTFQPMLTNMSRWKTFRSSFLKKASIQRCVKQVFPSLSVVRACFMMFWKIWGTTQPKIVTTYSDKYQLSEFGRSCNIK